MALKKQSKVRIQQLLRRCKGKELIVRLRRKGIDPDPLTGFVVELSPEFVLIHVRNEDIVLNGYTILRIPDITLVEDKPKFGDFYLEALKLRGYSPQRPSGIRLNSIASILESVNQHYPLVTIHREKNFPDVCTIGRLEKLTEKTVIFKWLTPGAKWDGFSQRYRLTSITKIDFGGLYEDALTRVAQILPDESGFYA